MDSAYQFLHNHHDNAIWQFSVKWIVTLAFAMFAFKLVSIALRYVVIVLIGLKRWVIDADLSLSPDEPHLWAAWRVVEQSSLGQESDEISSNKLSIQRRQNMVQSLLVLVYEWLSPSNSRGTVRVIKKTDYTTRPIKTWTSRA